MTGRKLEHDNIASDNIAMMEFKRPKPSGQTVVIRLDYDIPDWSKVLHRLAVGFDKLGLDRFRKLAVAATVHRTTGSGGYHIRIWLCGTFTQLTILAIQEALGDDRLRTLMSKRRIKDRDPNWNRLFSAKLSASDGKPFLESREAREPGCERSLNEMLFPDDGAFRKRDDTERSPYDIGGQY